jgi:hypothetical protein
MLRAATIGFLGIACLAWLPSPVAAEGERWFSAESDGGTFRLELQPSVTPLPVNELFELEVTVTLLRDLDDANPIWLGLRCRGTGTE